MVEPRLQRIWVTLALAAAAPLASAACNNPKNWLESPSTGVKYFIGYELDVRTSNSFGSELLIAQPERMAYPPLLPREMWEKSGSGGIDNVSEDSAKRKISYFEPDGKGNWRLCRVELWNPRESAPTEDGRSGATTYLESQVPRNRLVEQWGDRFVAVSMETYAFDSRGRLAVKREISTEPKGAKVYKLECFRYDDRDSVLLYVDAKVSKVCPPGEPDLRDDWKRLRVEWVDGQRVIRRYEYHRGLEAGGWRRDIDFGSADRLAPRGSARADSEVGIAKIMRGVRTAPKDENAVNVPRYIDGAPSHPVEYHFTRPPVPVSLIDNLETIYNYDRRRELSLGSSIRRVEWYRAGRTVAADSYILGAGSVIRHEQRDPTTGKLKRAINVAFEKFAGRPDALYDEPVIKKPLRLKGHEYLYRVWDYDAQGQPTLVAIGWNRSLRNQRMDEADIAFGTPDGKVKWKTKEAFFEAFGFDVKAKGAHLSTP